MVKPKTKASIKGKPFDRERVWKKFLEMVTQQELEKVAQQKRRELRERKPVQLDLFCSNL